MGSKRPVQDLAAPLAQILSDTSTGLGAGGSATYVYGNGAERLLALDGPWYLGDALGSLRMTLDSNGAPLATASYDPWGVPQGAAIAPFGFTGERQSGGDVYLRARWYDAGAGRFHSRDPFAGWPEQPYSQHVYQYGYSAPTMWTDPTGLHPDPTKGSISKEEGIIIHALIQKHYIEVVEPTNDIAIELAVPPTNGTYASAYLDIADFTGNMFYEIKPMSRSSQYHRRHLGEVERDLRFIQACDDARIRGLQRGTKYGRYTVSLWPVVLGSGYDPRRDGVYVVVAQRTAPGLIIYFGKRIDRNRKERSYNTQEVENFVRVQYPQERQEDWGEDIGWGDGRVLLPPTGVERTLLSPRQDEGDPVFIPPLVGPGTLPGLPRVDPRSPRTI